MLLKIRPNFPHQYYSLINIIPSSMLFPHQYYSLINIIPSSRELFPHQYYFPNQYYFLINIISSSTLFPHQYYFLTPLVRSSFYQVHNSDCQIFYYFLIGIFFKKIFRISVSYYDITQHCSSVTPAKRLGKHFYHLGRAMSVLGKLRRGLKLRVSLQ